jgi:hypothetical protein
MISLPSHVSSTSMSRVLDYGRARNDHAGLSSSLAVAGDAATRRLVETCPESWTAAMSGTESAS